MCNDILTFIARTLAKGMLELQNETTFFKSSSPKVFLRKSVPKICSNVQEKIHAEV